VSGADGLTAWERAGGFAESDWRELFEWVCLRAREAFVATADRDVMRIGAQAWLEEIDRLRTERDRWQRLRDGVAIGDPATYAEAQQLRGRERAAA
jgi:hypothetical protein